MEHKADILNSADAMENPPAYSATESNPLPMGDTVGQPITTANYVNHQIIPNTAPVITVIVGRPWGPNPQIIVCKSCNTAIETRVVNKPTTKTHITAALLCVLGGLLCVWVPYCMKTCRNADHYCPNCEAYIGSYKY